VRPRSIAFSSSPEERKNNGGGEGIAFADGKKDIGGSKSTARDALGKKFQKKTQIALESLEGGQ